MTKIRQPIITVAGHVDHGKTTILDQFRGSSVQEKEAGGITQKISFTKYPLEQIHKTCPSIKERGIDLQIPGFLFIDTPGHAAFTNLRKRGGSLADLAILVVDVKEGIKPQTAEVISVLKSNKTPFLIALNKVDTLSGWQKRDSVKESIDMLPVNVKQEFDTSLLTFQGALQNHGFNSSLFYEISDFTKEVAIVPCSARTGEGIPDLLFVLAGLSQKFLGERLKLGQDAKGVVLEIKKEKAMESIEAILYDGTLKENDELIVASFPGQEPLVTKVRSIEEILPLSSKYKSTSEATAATGVRIQITNKEGILPGMPFQKVSDNLEELKEKMKKEVSQAIKTEKQGIIVKADSLGSLEALLFLLKQSNIQVLKAGIGPITKTDIISAKANLEINPLDSVIVGFNVEPEEDMERGNIKIITNEVVYKLIEDLEEWRKNKQADMERERMLGLSAICKLEILHKFVFRNSNPAVFGVKVAGGKLRTDLNLIDENDEKIGRVKNIQSKNASISEAGKDEEVAISIPGLNFDRKLGDSGYLYTQISESQFREFKKNKDLLSSDELKALQELAGIKRKKNEDWGI